MVKSGSRLGVATPLPQNLVRFAAQARAAIQACSTQRTAWIASLRSQ